MTMMSTQTSANTIMCRGISADISAAWMGVDEIHLICLDPQRNPGHHRQPGSYDTLRAGNIVQPHGDETKQAYQPAVLNSDRVQEKTVKGGVCVHAATINGHGSVEK